MEPVRTNSGIEIPAHELEERFVRASGPGGQNVNKVSTAVELRFDVARSSLPHGVKVRLSGLAGRRLSSEGVIVIQAREGRTQAANREAARQRLRWLLEQAARPPRARRPTRTPRQEKEKRLAAKQRRSTVKRRRSRPSDDE